MKYQVPPPGTGETLVTAFLDALARSLTLRTDPSSPAGLHCARVFDALTALTALTALISSRPAFPEAVEGSLLPACSYVDDAVSSVDETGHKDLIGVAETLKKLVPRLRWMHRTGLRGVVADFPDRHANALVVGSEGLIRSSDVTIGATVMAPGTTYTDHSHPPEEVYLVLSSGEWRHRDGPWWQPGVGGFVHNPPGIVHAMRARNEPLFAVWLLLDAAR